MKLKGCYISGNDYMSQYYRSITGNRIVPSTIYERAMMFFVGLFGSLTMLTSFASVKFIPVSDATTLIFTVPLFTMILAAIFLQERLTVLKIICGKLLSTLKMIKVIGHIIFLYFFGEL